MAPLPRAARAVAEPHTPARDWPAPQSLSADTSGQPLPSSSRPLLPALGKKSGQRGAGTKDPSAHDGGGLGAVALRASVTNAPRGGLGAHTCWASRGLAEERSAPVLGVRS